MSKFHHAHVYYGQNRYDLNADLFPPMIDNNNPEQALPAIQAAVDRQKRINPRLEYGFVPGFQDVSPPFHIYFADGIRIGYVG